MPGFGVQPFWIAFSGTGLLASVYAVLLGATVLGLIGVMLNTAALTLFITIASLTACTGQHHG